MGLGTLIRAVGRINKTKEEIALARAKGEDITPLMRKRWFIARDLYREVESMRQKNPMVMSIVQNIAGLKISKVEQLYRKIGEETQAYGISIDEGVNNG